MDRFSALANEILNLISEEIPDYKTLFSLTLVSKNCYDIFNPGLYRLVSHDGQMRTVALSQVERGPLTGLHPASFVKGLYLFYYTGSGTWQRQQNAIGGDLFKRKAVSILKNVAQYATLRDLTLWFPEIPLYEVIGSVEPLVFDCLRTLHLVLCGSSNLNTPSLDSFESLCQRSPSLTCLRLQWVGFENSVPDQEGMSRLVGRLPQTCPKLQDFRLQFLNPNLSFESLQRVLDDPSFTFPLLQECHCDDFWKCNAFEFLLRHPGIEKLFCNSITAGGVCCASAEFLPKIRYFRGNALDYIALCTEYPPPIECLDLRISLDLDAEERTRFVSGLMHTRTLRQLVLDGFPPDEDILVLLGSIIKACSGLTHLTCRFDDQKLSMISDLYSTILHDLPNLEHLLLRSKCSLPLGTIFHAATYHAPHLQALSDHHSMKTVHISILVGSKDRHCSDFCFVKEKDRVDVVPLSNLDDSRFYKFF